MSVDKYAAPHSARCLCPWETEVLVSAGITACEVCAKE